MTNCRALLVLTSPLSQVTTKFNKNLSEIQNSKVVYIHLLPNVKKWPPASSIYKSSGLWSKTITNLYQNGTQSCSQIDLRILLGDTSLDFVPRPIDKIFIESGISEDFRKPYLEKILEKNGQEIIELQSDNCDQNIDENEDLSDADYKVYENVCLGGTFDRMHEGHKILLSQAAIRCQKKLTVGVTDESMLKSKKLNDLIEPVEKRIAVVSQFLKEIRGNEGENFVTPISDPFGPAITDETLQCIVGSEETKRGCEKINEIRIEKGFQPLDIHLIKLVDDSCHDLVQLEETKISSSNKRIRLLGEPLRPPIKAVSKPYVIGLTGGSASGKSSIARHLENLGAGVIDCDKLGHRAYEPGTACFDSILEALGSDLKAENGQIDRRKLGAKVFANPELLRKLESIVWPEILRMAMEDLKKLHEKEGKSVIILDAAVLLQAGWEKEVHEIWGAFIDRQEAIKRIVERDGKTEEQAEARLSNQMSNHELISKCNTIFYTKWDYSITHQQVAKAWSRLNRIL